MEAKILEQLRAEGLLSPASVENIQVAEGRQLVSVHWEIKTLLYLGVLLLTAGLGILVYKNIDTIGHQFILLFIALVCAGSFYYCFKNKLPFSTGKVEAPNAFFDYVLLLACSTFIIFIAYLQYQYLLFGNRYGLATFIPMVLLFASAYYFDHQGILGMAIVNLAAWAGINVTPMQVLSGNDFSSSPLIFTGLALGLVLIGAAWLSQRRNIKAHFAFTYDNFGTHILLISSLAAMFNFERTYMAWFLLFLLLVGLLFKKALQDNSFYFVLVITLYAFVGLSYVVVRLLSGMGGDGMGAIYLGFLYFIISAVCLVVFLIRINKKIRQHDHL